MNLTTDSMHLAISTESEIAIPICMFVIGITSNGLAIFSLILFLRKREDIVNIHNCQQVSSPIQVGSTHELEPIERERLATGSSCTGTPVGLRSRRKHSVKFGPFHTLVLILAILDLLGSLCTTPLTIILYVKNVRITHLGGMPLCFYSAFALMFFGFTTMAMVMTMAVERLLSIRYPFYYHAYASAKKAMLAAFSMLFVGLVLCLLPVFGFGTVKEMHPFSYCFSDWNAAKTKDIAFNYLYVGVGAAMLIITIICNAIVIQGLLKMNKSMMTKQSLQRQATMSYEKQMIIQLLAITFIFIICWLPLLITMLANEFGAGNSFFANGRLAIWLLAANPILDPWVYILCRHSVLECLIQHVKRLPCIKSSNTTRTWFVQSTPCRPHLTPELHGRCNSHSRADKVSFHSVSTNFST